jgi:hypothetical protein
VVQVINWETSEDIATIEHGMAKTKIESVYQAVSKFIDWHKDQNKNS